MRPSYSALEKEYQLYLTTNEIGVNREQRNVLARHAFMVAARDVYTTLEIARATKLHHATVIHATKNHEMNTFSSSMYIEFFNQSLMIMQRLREDESFLSPEQIIVKENIFLRKRIDSLRAEVHFLESKLEKQSDKVIEHKQLIE